MRNDDIGERIVNFYFFVLLFGSLFGVFLDNLPQKASLVAASLLVVLMVVNGVVLSTKIDKLVYSETPYGEELTFLTMVDSVLMSFLLALYVGTSGHFWVALGLSTGLCNLLRVVFAPKTCEEILKSFASYVFDRLK